MNQTTRNNHYVPEWYQYGFHVAGQTRMPYLNLQPENRILHDGRVITFNDQHIWGPAKCFCEYDLYTTHFANSKNDEVERFLFGSIDERGAKAVRAFANGDPSAMHHAFEDFFEYMDAQKLRTPKGLDWLKTRYAALNQMQLMREMQGVRMMHCTLWAEGIREFVTAKDSSVKFIVTDHPVTVYNAAILPSASASQYPDDPTISQVGTQTIFALNSETCLILTHLEYAQQPQSANLTAHRTNARYRGRSFIRTDAHIKGRELSADEVIAINFVLKSRAKKYIAASEEDWLYPEKYFNAEWASIATILLPSKEKLWGFGGETYIGFKDGTSAYNDAFGRTSKSHEYLTRKEQRNEIGSNDLCGCDSGILFEKCCQGLPENDRPSWKIYSIRERNLMFSRAVQGVLKIEIGERTWEDVRLDLSADQVKQIHELFAGLWPEDTDLQELLPRPNPNVCRAIYMGVTDPRTVAVTVLAWLPFFDQIILPHPFSNAQRMRPEYSPTAQPNAHKAQTLKNVFTLLLLEPFIEAGVVHLIPDPGDFNSQFGMSTMSMAMERTKRWEPDYKKSRLKGLMEDEHRRLMFGLSERSLQQLIRRQHPEASEDLIAEVVEHARAEQLKDPFSLLQKPVSGEKGAQLLSFKCFNLESAIFLAATTGSLIYTDELAQWKQLRDIGGQQKDPKEQLDRLEGMLDGTATLVDANPNSIIGMIDRGQFENIKVAFKALSNVLQEPSETARTTEVCDLLQTAIYDVQTKIEGATHSVSIQFFAPESGFQSTETARLLLTFADRMPKSKAVVALLLNPEDISPASRP